jgi:hypothetical protein
LALSGLAAELVSPASMDIGMSRASLDALVDVYVSRSQSWFAEIGRNLGSSSTLMVRSLPKKGERADRTYSDAEDSRLIS